ncbi:MAG: methionine synthase [Lactobacillales bacterium]|nr:methionine synthase [Lactobacillales bacterium]
MKQREKMLPLEKSEVLRYLGYRRKQELTVPVEKMVNELMLEVQQVSHPRYSYKIFDVRVDEENQAIQVGDTELLLTGKHIYSHLKNAEQVVLLAATLGIEVERQTRLYEMTDMTKAFILDACCVEYIEKICDLAECDIDEMVGEDWTLNRRFSPGYGDLPLSVQPDFLRIMEADKKLGLHLTDTLLMVPRKSVTAIIGLFSEAKMARPRRKAPENLSAEMAKTYGFRIENNE